MDCRNPRVSFDRVNIYSFSSEAADKRQSAVSHRLQDHSRRCCLQNEHYATFAGIGIALMLVTETRLVPSTSITSSPSMTYAERKSSIWLRMYSRSWSCPVQRR